MLNTHNPDRLNTIFFVGTFYWRSTFNYSYLLSLQGTAWYRIKIRLICRLLKMRSSLNLDIHNLEIPTSQLWIWNYCFYFIDISCVKGDDDNNKEALNCILQKVVEDPQSGSCLNISYSEIQVYLISYFLLWNSD